MDKHITTPITAEVTKNLKSGDYVYITGTVYVARDAAHKRMTEVSGAGRSSDRFRRTDHCIPHGQIRAEAS